MGSLWAQEDTGSIVIDDSNISEIEFSDDLAEKYSGEDFNYDSVQGEAENLLTRLLNWIFKGLQNVFGVTINPELVSLLENIIYVILIGFAIYIIIRILVGKDAVSFFRKRDTIVAPLNITEEHIEKINLDELITNALEEKNYRLAIRYMYLKALQDLSIQKIIEYHFEKTNTDYYREITDVTLKQNFNRVSYLYDYIWYGKFELDKGGYLNAKESFDALHVNMKNFG